MKSRRLLALLGCFLGVVLLAALVAGCEGETTTTAAQSATSSSAVTGSTGGTTTPTEAGIVGSVLECPQGPVSGDTPQYGGTLTVIHSGAPTNLGAFWSTVGFMDSVHARWAIENLVGLNEKGEAVPQLATTWDVDEAAKTITFHLREGVKFHDGTDFNAEAAKWNLDMFLAGTNTGLEGLTSVDVVDGYTIRLNMSEMDPIFIKGLSASNAGKMVSPTAYKTNGEDYMKKNPVGTGPFKFVEYKTARSLKFEKWEGYWQEGLPYLDAVEIKLVADPVVRLTSYKNGEGQVLYQSSAADAKALEAEGSSIKSRIMSLWCIAGDSKSPDSPFSDQKVREAVAYAIDNDTIVNGVFGGFMLPIHQLGVEGIQAYNPDVVGYPYDVAKAKQLLAESKFNISPANPWNTVLSYNAGDENTEMFTLIQESLAEIGINVTLKPEAYPAMVAKSQKGFKNELMLFGLSYNGIEMEYSTSLRANLSEDSISWVDVWIPDEFNALYRQMRVEKDLAARELLYQQMNKMAVDDYCLVCPLMLLKMVTPVAPQVHDLGYADVAIEFLPENAWMEQQQ
jgi:peptide/nickel transport system substrate-binding protein